MNPTLTTPVVLIIFNRPQFTARVFEEIRRARPSKLLVVADGPRADRAGEMAKCAEARRVIDGVDWPCEVLRNYSETNMGCSRRPATGLDWVFGEVEEAIILEDDCMPHPTFFRYCAEMLEKYREDERIFHISGNHFGSKGEKNPYSYYFSRYPYCWGWATWRRAWKHFDLGIKIWPTIRDGHWLNDFLEDKYLARRFTREFESIYTGETKTVWDYQFGLASWINSGLSIHPRANLISNIGFTEEATHTADADSTSANIPTVAMEFPLRHPPFMMRNVYEDGFLPDGLARKTIAQRAIKKLKRLARKGLSFKKAVAGSERPGNKAAQGEPRYEGSPG